METTLIWAVRQQQPLTALPERLAWTAVMIAGVVWLLLAARRAWRRRARRQEAAFDLPELPDPGTEGPAVPVLAGSDGLYLGTVLADTPEQRVPGHGLAFPARSAVVVTEAGVLFRREGSPPLYLPNELVLGLGLQAGFAGRYVGHDGVIVLRWRPESGFAELLTGYRIRHSGDVVQLVSAMEEATGFRCVAAPA